MDDLQRENGMMEATQEQSDWRLTTLYRCMVVNETPAGQEINRKIVALKESAAGKYQ